MYVSLEVRDMPKKVWTEEKIEQFKDYVNQGLCYEEIAQKLQLTNTQVRGIAARLRIFPKHKIDVSGQINIGDKIGKLTVIDKYYDTNTKYYQCKCVCECGKEITRKLYYLIQTPNASCGCEKKGTNLIGKRFGRWTVLERAGFDQYTHAMWKCRCDCGNERNVYQEALLTGTSVSCGCYNKEIKRQYHPERRILNEYDLSNEYGVGFALNTGNPFFFDKEDYEKIKKYSWREDSTGYITTNDYSFRRGQFGLHRYIMDFPSGLVIDHLNHDIKDNRKINLRLCTIQENILNSKVPSNNTSGIKGVRKNGDKWYAVITINGNNINLGTYKTFEEAIEVRKNAELEYFGEYSYSYTQSIAPSIIQFNKGGD